MPEFAHQVRLIRARIENAFATPCALLISSALPTDGKSVCAQGLAESMAAAGYKTLLLEIDHEDAKLGSLPQHDSLGTPGDTDAIVRNVVFDAKSRLAMLALSNVKLGTSASKSGITDLIATLRHSFEYIIVDAAPLMESSIGVLFATVCNAIILTTREGRAVRSEDHAILETIKRERLNFLGVVTVSPRAISNFHFDVVRGRGRRDASALILSRRFETT